MPAVVLVLVLVLAWDLPAQLTRRLRLRVDDDVRCARVDRVRELVDRPVIGEAVMPWIGS